MSPSTVQREPRGAEDQGYELPRMSFGDHLDELRRRLLISIAAIVGGVLVVLPFKSAVTDIYTAPYEQMWFWGYQSFLTELDAKVAQAEEQGVELHPTIQEHVAFNARYREEILTGTFPEESYNQIYSRGGFLIPRTLKAMGGLSDFWTFMAATFLFGLFLGAPIVLYQMWAFIGAGLYPHEKQAVLRFFPFGLGLLFTGMAFGYLLVVPTGLYFLVKLMNWAKVESMMSVELYFSFLLTLTAALGAVFQLPLVMLAVQKVGLVSHRSMAKNWRYVILGFFVFAAVITPPDPFTQSMMAIPMVLLYGVGLLLTSRRAKSDAGALESV